MACKTLLVVGIDFGTTYSGGAFSFRHDFNKDPTKICTQTFQGGNLLSHKGLTCALIKSDGKTLDKFGYEAEDRYLELAGDNEHHSVFFFRRFKMKLWNQEINRHTEIEDQTGKKLPAMTVFSLSIKYLKEEMLKLCNSHIGGGIKANEIHWVLTVPAIWDNPAKQFMREAAVMAGLDGKKLSIALEPEAASLLCRHNLVNKGQETGLAQFKVGMRYVVLDAGGGTVDVTIHEVTSDYSVKELSKPSGGAWGGTKVDKAFLEFLTEILGDKVMDKFKTDNTDDYINLLRDFETKKRNIGPEWDDNVTFQLPLALSTIVKKVHKKTIEDVIKGSIYSKEVSVKTGKLKIKPDIMRGFFSESVGLIVDHLKYLIGGDDPVVEHIKAVLMVGGFSESPLLKKAVKEAFPDLTVIVPVDADLAVLKGAVIFGHDPTAIQERISKHTYGVEVKKPFNKDIHPWYLREEDDDGTVWCRRVFSKHIEIGQSMNINEAQSDEAYYVKPFSNANVVIYASEEKDPKYVTGCKCFKVGNISLPFNSNNYSKKLFVRMIFGGTEIRVECEDHSGDAHDLCVQFLQ